MAQVQQVLSPVAAASSQFLAVEPKTPANSAISTSPVRAALSSSKFVTKRVAQFNLLSPVPAPSPQASSFLKKRASPTTMSPSHPAKRRRIASTGSPFLTAESLSAQRGEAAVLEAPSSIESVVAQVVEDEELEEVIAPSLIDEEVLPEPVECVADSASETAIPAIEQAEAADEEDAEESAALSFTDSALASLEAGDATEATETAQEVDDDDDEDARDEFDESSSLTDLKSDEEFLLGPSASSSASASSLSELSDEIEVQRSTKAAEQLRQRKLVADELRSTEDTYYRTLRTLCKQKRKLVEYFDVHDKAISAKMVLVFGNVEEIYELSKALLQTINAQFKLTAMSGDAPPLAEVVIHWSQRILEPYIRYQGNYGHGIAALNKVTHSAHAQQYEPWIRAMFQSIQGSLITPVQRLPRYTMLLERLEKYTSDFEERVRLQLARGSIRSILEQIEKELGNMLQQEAMTRLLSCVKVKTTEIGFEEFVLDMTADGDKRKWEFEHVIHVSSYPASTSDGSSEAQQQQLVVVFQDIVLLCAPHRHKYVAVHQLPIEATFAEVHPTESTSVLLLGQLHSFELHFALPKEAMGFVRKFNQTVDKRTAIAVHEATRKTLHVVASDEGVREVENRASFVVNRCSKDDYHSLSITEQELRKLQEMPGYEQFQNRHLSRDETPKEKLKRRFSTLCSTASPRALLSPARKVTQDLINCTPYRLRSRTHTSSAIERPSSTAKADKENGRSASKRGGSREALATSVAK